MLVGGFTDGNREQGGALSLILSNPVVSFLVTFLLLFSANGKLAPTSGSGKQAVARA
jgi:hypothetical protein